MSQEAMQDYLGQYLGEFVDTDVLASVAVEIGLAGEGEFDPSFVNLPENQFWLNQVD